MGSGRDIWISHCDGNGKARTMRTKASAVNDSTNDGYDCMING
jgi:hypothetical protein